MSTSPFEVVFERGYDLDAYLQLKADESAGTLPDYPTYTATGARNGSEWEITVPGLPDGTTATVQARTWRRARAMAFDFVARFHPGEEDHFFLHVIPDDQDAANVAQAVTDARVARAEAEFAELVAARDAARLLTARGWSVRDVGDLLSLSPSRISELAPQRPTDPPQRNTIQENP